MLDRAQAILLVIDIQDKLFPRDAAMVESLLTHSMKLIRAARILNIPVLVTEQNPDKLGATNVRVGETVGEAPRFSKMEFGCLGNAVFRAALTALGRNQLIVVGMETHICVMQTVLAALEEGYEAYVVRDAVSSMEPCEREAGLDRMARAGAIPITTQRALFELLRAAGTPEFRAMLPLLK